MKVGPQPITCVRNTSGEEESLRPQIYMGSPQEGDQYYFFYSYIATHKQEIKNDKHKQQCKSYMGRESELKKSTGILRIKV